MKKATILFLGLVLLLSGCDMPKEIIPGPQTGSLNITFHFIESLSVRIINDDLSQVNSGKVYLKQGDVTKYQGNFTLDLVNKTGSCNISDIKSDSYDIIVELYDASDMVLYQGQDTVHINPGDNGTKNITIVKNTANLTISGNWTEDINGLATAIVQLKKDSTVKYARNLVLNLDNKTVSGGINNIYPDTYEVYIEIRNSGGSASFTGSQMKVITTGENSVSISLIIKTGSIGFNLNGDFTAPVITSGPNVAVVGQDVTITWNSNENATSEVCYSTTSGFNYLTQTDWSPVGGDLTADHTSHSVTISGLAYNTYYYVIVSTDASGNMMVSDEDNFIVADIPRNGLIGEWLFYGNANDTSGNGNNGTVNGATLTSDRFGNNNKAYYFNDSFIDVGNPANNLFDLTSNFTISAWVKYSDFLGVSAFIGKDEGGGETNKWYLCWQNTEYCFHRNSPDGPSDYNIRSNSLTETAQLWYHIVLTRNGNNYNFYRDNINIGNYSSDVIIPVVNHNLYIGYGEPTQYFIGSVDDVRIYNRDLNEAEIQALYNVGGWTGN